MPRERKKKSEFGEYLAQLIKDAGMTQFEFYSEADIARPYFWMCWRNGSRRTKSAARNS